MVVTPVGYGQKKRIWNFKRIHILYYSRIVLLSPLLFDTHAAMESGFPMFSKPKFENRKLKRPQFLYQAVQDEVKAYIIEQSLVPGDALPPETEFAILYARQSNLWKPWG
jgi:hypothetical protein